MVEMVSSNINEVIRSVLNFSIFFHINQFFESNVALKAIFVIYIYICIYLPNRDSTKKSTMIFNWVLIN